MFDKLLGRRKPAETETGKPEDGTTEVALSDGEAEAMHKIQDEKRSRLAAIGELSIKEEALRMHRLKLTQSVADLEQKFAQRLHDKAENAGYSSAVSWDLDRKVITVR